MATRLYYSNLISYYAKVTGLPKGVELPTIVSARPAGVMTPGLTLARPETASQALDTLVTASVAGSYLVGQFATPPLAAAVAFSGTVKGQMRLLEYISSMDDTSEMYIYIVDSNWAYKSKLLGPSGPGSLLSEWSAAAATNRPMPYGGAVNLTPQNAAIGDRILVLIGVKTFSTNLGVNRQFNWASSAVADLPEDSTTTTDLAPWLEFSNTLTFGADSFPAVGVNPYTIEVSEIPLTDIDMDYDLFASLDPDQHVPTIGQIWPRGN